VADRGCEPPHEVFRRQIDDAKPTRVLYGRVGDRLEKVGLAETDRGMHEERVETHGACPRFRDGLGRSQADAVGTALDKGVEGKARVERRTEERSTADGWTGCDGLSRLGRDLTGSLRRRTTDLCHRSRFWKGNLLIRAGGLRSAPRCRTHQNFDF